MDTKTEMKLQLIVEVPLWDLIMLACQLPTALARLDISMITTRLYAFHAFRTLTATTLLVVPVNVILVSLLLPQVLI
jgi:hypothetical protein